MFSEMTTNFMIPNKKTGKVDYYNPYDIYGLGTKSFHRRTNHDPVTSAIMTTMEAGPDSVPLAHLHTMLDAISDDMKTRYGRATRDLIMAQMNFNLEKMVRRHHG